jgi:ATP-binding cassette, subfamily B, bacterial
MTREGFHAQRSRRAEQRAERLLAPRGQLAQLRHVPRALKLVWSAAPDLTITSTALLVVQGLLPVFTVYLTRDLTNGLVDLIESGGDPALLSAALVPMVLMAAVMLLTTVLGSFQSYVRSLLAERTQDQMSGLIHAKAIALDLQFYQSPTYYDQLQRASLDAIDRPLALLDSLGSLLQNTITLVAMVGVLLTLAWWIPLALLVGTLPALWVALRSNWQMHRWRLRNTVQQRRLSYFGRILTSDTAAAELRLFDLGGYFRDAYQQLRRRLFRERRDLLQTQLLGQLFAGLCGLATLAVTLGWMVWQVLQGRFNLGDLTMLWGALNQGQRLMRSLLTGVGDIYQSLLFLEDLFVFLDLEPRLRDPAEPAVVAPGLRQGLRLDDVTFRYPDSATDALHRFHLAIPAGQIIAIVGENGAGKSTLLKLLCRFYDPQAGSVTWDGVDLRAMTQADLRRRITVLFQDPFPYHDSAADNIRFGDLAGHPSQAQIEQAARASGAAEIIDRLPEGYATVLGKWFGHTELSIGEWQRLALARAFIRQADLIVLDEPTSAMDSWAEAEWLGRFRALAAGRTAVIVTHRFTTAMQADVIHVMHRGEIVESGAHAELVALGGRYAQSWNQQMRETAQKA